MIPIEATCPCPNPEIENYKDGTAGCKGNCPKYRAEFLDLALNCGAVLTGKPDASEPITIVFSIEAWRKFDLATAETQK